MSDTSGGNLIKYLTIGINYTGTPDELNGCHRDADTFESFIKEKHPEAIGASLRDKFMFSWKHTPNYENVSRALKWVLSTSTKKHRRYKSGSYKNINDDPMLVYIYYSGHGASEIDDDGDECVNGEECDAYDGCLCLTDKWMRDDEMYSILSEYMTPNMKVVIVTDCCHSATICDLPWIYRDQKMEKVSKRQDLPGTIIHFGGCYDKDVSYETKHDGKAAGSLTYYFIKACHKRSGLHEIYDYIIKNICWQVPVLSTGKNEDIEDLEI